MSEANEIPDFFEAEEKRKAWHEIGVGDLRPSQEVEVTQEQIATFAEAIEDDNPLYVDEAEARKSQFGGIIAPPTFHAALMFMCLSAEEDWMRTPGTINAGQRWSYREPVRPGDQISLRAMARDKYLAKGRRFVIHDNEFRRTDGSIVTLGGGWTIRPR